MSGKIVLGPILGIESNTRYTFLVVTVEKAESVSAIVGGNAHAAEIVLESRGYKVWKACSEVAVPAGETGQYVDYSIMIGNRNGTDRAGNEKWRFYVPADQEEPRVAYTSCNGAAESGHLGSLEEAYDLWNKMVTKHDESPYSLLLMGGDQVYCDSIWQEVAELKEWPELSHEQKIKKNVTKALRNQLEAFYLKTIYLTRWSDFRMMHMMASVPSIMMWDDHDIFDGWGSFPDSLQNCPVYQAIFESARKHFEIFQVRGKGNSALLSNEGSHYSQLLKFRNVSVLALDNRSERSISQVMSPEHWRDVKLAMSEAPVDSNLYVMSAVPVVYRDFSAVEYAMEATPWQETLEDDVLDHWRAKRHQGERMKLIMNLLSNTRRREGRRTLILSGDVHVGCMGVIFDRSSEEPVKVHQVVSSGVVHPAPSWLAWQGICLVTNDKPENLNEDGSIVAKMVQIVGANEYIRIQNFASIEPSRDGKLWISWECKNGDRPVYAIE